MDNEYIDHTMPRILAYLASVCAVEGEFCRAEDQNEFSRGHALVRRMAFSAAGMDVPCVRLTVEECADVVMFLSHVEPIEPREFFKEPDDVPSHLVGYYLVLANVRNELRRHATAVRPVKARARKIASRMQA
jgi:hypothetical protein